MPFVFPNRRVAKIIRKVGFPTDKTERGYVTRSAHPVPSRAAANVRAVIDHAEIVAVLVPSRASLSICGVRMALPPMKPQSA